MTTGSKTQHLRFMQKRIEGIDQAEKDQAVKQHTEKYRRIHFIRTGTLFDRSATIRQMSRVMMVLFFLSFFTNNSVFAMGSTGVDAVQVTGAYRVSLETNVLNASTMKPIPMPRWQLDVFESNENQNNEDEQPLEFGKWMMSTPLKNSSVEGIRDQSTNTQWDTLFRVRRWKPEEVLEITEEYTGRRLEINGRFEAMDVQTQPIHIHLRKGTVINTLHLADHLEDITLTMDEGADIREIVRYSEEERRLALREAEEEEQREAAERREAARRRREDRADRDREEEMPVLPAPTPAPDTGTGTEPETDPVPQPKSHFAGGWGTAASPYIISTPEHLKALGDYPENEPLADEGEDDDDEIGADDAPEQVTNYLNAHYLIQLPDGITSLDMTDIAMKPIGSDNAPFTGRFNGNGAIVSNIHINTRDSDTGGIFGVIGETGRVENINLRDIQIIGRGMVGGLAGENRGSIASVVMTQTASMGNGISVENISFSGFPIINNIATGGLCAVNSGNILNSFVDINVSSAFSNVGMIAGINSGTIKRSRSIGEITNCYQILGGIAGLAVAGNIEDCYSTTNLCKTANHRGALIGRVKIESGQTVIIQNSYADVSVKGPNIETRIGLLVGSYNSGGTLVVENCYYNSDYVLGDSVMGNALTGDEMKLQDKFNGWSFTEPDSIWVMADRGDGILRPRLCWE